MREEIASSINGAGKTTCKRIKPDYFLTLYTKINSKSIKDLNVRPKTIRLLEENISSMLFDISLSNIFWVCFQRQGKQKQTNIWDYIKIKSFCVTKETIKKTRR